VIAFLPVRPSRQWFTTKGATESFLKFFQPLINSASLDSRQVGSQVNSVLLQVVSRELFKSLARVSLEIRTFIAELQPLCIQTLHDFALDAPAVRSQGLTAFTTHFLWRAFEVVCQSLAILSPVSVGSIDPTRPTVEATPSYQIPINHHRITIHYECMSSFKVLHAEPPQINLLNFDVRTHACMQLVISANH